MEELHTDSIDGGHEAIYGARSRVWIVQNSCQSLALELFVSATQVQIECFKKIIFMTQGLYQFDQKLELYTTAFSDL
jgi:hypothetical protein